MGGLQTGTAAVIRLPQAALTSEQPALESGIFSNFRKRDFPRGPGPLCSLSTAPDEPVRMETSGKGHTHPRRGSTAMARGSLRPLLKSVHRRLPSAVATEMVLLPESVQ